MAIMHPRPPRRPLGRSARLLSWFYLHLAVYLATAALTVALNGDTAAGGLRPYWPLAAWAAVVIGHAFVLEIDALFGRGWRDHRGGGR